MQLRSESKIIIMKTLGISRSVIRKVIGFIGLLTVIFLAFLFVKANYLPSNGSNEMSLATNPIEATQVLLLLPTFTPFASQTPPTTPTPILLDNGWYLYTDPDLEFSFAYPSTALIFAGQNPVDLSKNINIQFQLPDKAFQGMSIRLESNPKRLDGVEIARQLYEKSSQKPAPVDFSNTLKPISVGGLTAIQAEIPSMNTEITVIVPFEDKVLILSPVHDTPVTKVEKEILELFYKILDTFKFNIAK
jgi:hypothetical protein